MNCHNSCKPGTSGYRENHFVCFRFRDTGGPVASVVCSIPGFRFAGASGSVPVGHVCGGVTLVVMVVVATGMFTVVRVVFVSEGVWSLFKRHGSSKPFRCMPGITPCS